ncbi:MAG: RagB/SusD family nutrient uptake outer membrane protein [Bacteroidales bacterium]
MKKYKIVLLVCLYLLTGVSCTDFLDEVSKIDKTEGMVYSTAEDFESLVAMCYGYMKGFYGKESMLAMGELGTDLWSNALDPNTASDFNIYQNLGAEMAWPLSEVPEFLYVAINTCNLAIEYVSTSGDLLTEDRKKVLESEARFLRAYYYWIIVETWGAMQINKEPVRSAGTTSKRDPEQEIYSLMFEDLKYCIDNLPNNVAPDSRVSWLAAKAFKARLALYYAGDYYKNRVKVDYKGIDYYAVALQEAKDVIDASAGLGKKLYTNYGDVWDINKSHTPINDEFIWAVDYYDEIGPTNFYNYVPIRPREDNEGKPVVWNGLFTRQPESGGGNCQHLWLGMRIASQNNPTGGPPLQNILIRTAGEHLNYTKESDSLKTIVDVKHWYVRYMSYAKFGPSRFLNDLFDEKVDQRWDVTFHTAWYKHPDIVPQFYVSNPAKCLYPKMSVGTQTDTALYYSKYPLTQAQKDWAQGRYKILDVTNIYNADGTLNTFGKEIFPHFAKFMNTQSTITLPATNFSDYYSKIDFPVFRLSEMYLIAAEAALLGAGGSSVAYPYIELLANARAIGGNGAALLASYNITGAADIDLDFILDERAREFVGENMRWFDLKRTMKLEERVKLYNAGASSYFDANKHYLRPIPSILIEASTNRSDVAGVGMWQNPNY